MKVLWGMFAFPLLYPGAFLTAAGVPLLGLIAITLVWVSGAVTPDTPFAYWGSLVANYLLFAWLAVRTHRMVLIGPDDELRAPGAHAFSLTFRYLAALATGAALKFLIMIVIMVAVMLISYFLPGEAYVPATVPTPPRPDPDVQRWIDYGTIAAQVPAIYLLARWSTLLPAIALGHAWAPGAARLQTRGNGWRLVLVVFALPWLLDAAVEWVYAHTGNHLLVALLAIARAMFLALGVIALSLSYRELPAWPEPPPTPPRA